MSFLEEDVQSGLSHGQLSFLLRAGSDSLPHHANLRRWNIQCASKCPLCSSTRPTTTHILNGCPTALQQGRFTWHHDSVIKSIFINLKDNLPHDVKIYADLDHWRAEDNPPTTIPPEILSTSSRPDIVIIHNTREIQILELTVPSNSKSALQNARIRKQNKENYNYLVNDLKDRKWNTTYHTVEISSLGHIPKKQL